MHDGLSFCYRLCPKLAVKMNVIELYDCTEETEKLGAILNASLLISIKSKGQVCHAPTEV